MASTPTKISYLVGEFLDLSGLVIKKYVETDGVEDSGVKVSSGEYSLSVSEGSVLKTASSLLMINVISNEEGVGSTSFAVLVRNRGEFSVVFKNYDGTPLSSLNVTEGHSPEYNGDYPSHPSDENGAYLFEGWVVEGTNLVVDLDEFKVSESVTFIASFALSSYSSNGVLEFTKNEAGTGYIVSGFLQRNASGDYNSEVHVPDTYEGLPVVELGNSLFKQMSGITTLILGSNLTKIDDYACYGLTGVTSIVIPAKVAYIGYQAFRGCTSITSLEIPSSVKEIAKQGFYSCKMLTNLTLNEGLTAIAEEAFAQTNITSLVLPDSLTSLGEDAFAYDQLLGSVTLGNGLSSIKDVGFQKNCKGLSKYVVKENNPYFSVANDGILYSADGKVLVSCPINWCVRKDDGSIDEEATASFQIDDNVETIGYQAFYGHAQTAAAIDIKTLTLGKKVATIEDCAFDNCKQLQVEWNNGALTSVGSYLFRYSQIITDLVLPDSVTTVGDHAFANMSNLLTFKFGKGVVTLGSNIFESSSKVVVSFDGENPNLSIEGNVIYDAAKTKCLYWLKDDTVTSYAMPSSVVEVADYFLSGNTKLTSLTLSSSLKKIGSYAFNGLTKVKGALALPASLEEVGEKGFYGMSLVTSLSLPSSLVSIGKNAFANLKAAASAITIPESVTFVGESAFSGSVKLTSVTVNNASLAVNEFYGCTGITSMTLSDSIAELPEKVFYNCSKIASLTLPSSLKTIGKYALSGTKLLKALVLPSSLETIRPYGLSGLSVTSIEIPSSVKEFGVDEKDEADNGYVFYNSTALTSIVINATLNSLDQDTFYGCTGLTSVTLPSSIVSVGESAFQKCSKLASIALPSAITSVGEHAFDGCSSLASIDLSSVISLGDYAFNGCSKLASVTLNPSLTAMGACLFNGCSSLNEVSLPTSLEEIGYSAFSSSGLTSFTLGEGVRLNSKGAQFKSCSSLATITLNSTINTIYPNLFESCSSLSSVLGLKEQRIIGVGSNAFNGCSSLLALPFSSADIEAIGSGAFKGTGLSEFLMPTNENFVSVEANTFASCTKLSSITLPSHVASIGSSSFASCTKLASFSIENPDFEISGTYAAAFKNDTALTEITYAGTVSQAGSKFTLKNTGLSAGSLTIHCADGDYVLA